MAYKVLSIKVVREALRLDTLAGHYYCLADVSPENLAILRQLSTQGRPICVISPVIQGTLHQRNPRRTQLLPKSAQPTQSHLKPAGESGNFSVLDEFPGECFAELSQSFEKLFVFPEWARWLSSDSVTFEELNPKYTVCSEDPGGDGSKEYTICKDVAHSVKMTQARDGSEILWHSCQSFALQIYPNRLGDVDVRVPLRPFPQKHRTLCDFFKVISKVPSVSP